MKRKLYEKNRKLKEEYNKATKLIPYTIFCWVGIVLAHFTGIWWMIFIGIILGVVVALGYEDYKTWKEIV